MAADNADLGFAIPCSVRGRRIGGMAFSTFITLLVLPAIFTLLMKGASAKSPSLDPDDEASSHYDPTRHSHDGYSHEAPDGRNAESAVHRPDPNQPSTHAGP